MNRLFGPGRARILAAGLVVLTFAQPAAAEMTTVNGVEIDSAVVDLYVNSRTQNNQGPLTPEQREIVLEELSDLYLLSMEATDAHENDPRIYAQIEIQKRALLAQLIATEFLNNNRATDEEILLEYGRQIEMAPPLDFKASHILVESQAQAADLITLLDGGAEFAQLARENSLDSSADQGGDLGWFRPDMMVAPFAAALESLENGGYTPTPVQTQFGWHVILREDSRLTEPPTLESVRDVITQAVEQEKLRAYIEGLRPAITE